jgi:hypothetical protein
VDPCGGAHPGWILTLVPLAEIAAILLAIAAIWLDVLVRRDGEATTSSERGGRLALLVVLLVVGGSLVGKALVP